MTTVTVLKTDGSMEELNKSIYIFHLYLETLDFSYGLGYDMGDVLHLADVDDRWYSLIVRTNDKSKFNLAALRLALYKFFYGTKSMMLDNNMIPIMISSKDFQNQKEETTFICTFKEICLTFFGEFATNEIKLIITDKTN